MYLLAKVDLSQQKILKMRKITLVKDLKVWKYTALQKMQSK